MVVCHSLLCVWGVSYDSSRNPLAAVFVIIFFYQSFRQSAVCVCILKTVVIPPFSADQLSR